MLANIVLPGWVPFYGINLSRTSRGISRPRPPRWTTRVGTSSRGCLGRLRTRNDVDVHQRYAWSARA